MYLALLWKCERVFDTDSRNGIHISYKKASINKGDFKEIINKYVYLSNTKDCICSNKRFCGVVVTEQI